MPVADIINAVIPTYTSHTAYDNYRIRYLALIPDGCDMMASHQPDWNSHVIRHTLVQLFTKPTAAFLDDENFTGHLIHLLRHYIIKFGFGI
jgi:hypothetical protein